MPSWQPNWSDVVFDHRAAEAAASALERAAAGVRESYDTAAREDQRLSRQWKGAHRRGFEHDLAQGAAAASRDIDSLRFEAARIRNAADAAQGEQWHRERSREQWRHEAAAEEAARQEVARQEVARQEVARREVARQEAAQREAALHGAARQQR